MSPSLVAATLATRSAAASLTTTSSSYAIRGAIAIGKRTGQRLCFSSSAAFASNPYEESDDLECHHGGYRASDRNGQATTGRRHCDTCTCSDEELRRQQQEQLQHEQEKRSQCFIPPETISDRLPPPLPEPKYSYHKRLMPNNLTSLSSKVGRQRFLEALSTGNAEAYLPLAEQFLNQSDPAYCGVTTLAMVLNACAVDPNVRWRGGWRWYGSDDVVLDRCCLGSERGRERVRRSGISLEEFAGLGRCQGLGIEMKRPCIENTETQYKGEVDADVARNGPRQQHTSRESECWTVDDFRYDIQRMVQMPPLAQEESEYDEDHMPITSDGVAGAVAAADDSEDRGFLVVSFSRSHLNQTGSGHFSPVAAYHPPSDSCLILDVARFKYSPYWVSIGELYEATKPQDESTGKSRGWFVVKPPKVQRNQVFGYQGINKTDEGMRPADAVPLVGSKDSGRSCSGIKIDYCNVGFGGDIST